MREIDFRESVFKVADSRRSITISLIFSRIKGACVVIFFIAGAMSGKMYEGSFRSCDL